MTRSLPFAALLICAVLTACGGGGGGSSPAPAPIITPTPATPTPIATLTSPPTGGPGFVPAGGPITTLSAVNGNFGSTMLAASTSANFIVQSGSQPARPTNPSALGTFTISASETAGLSTSAVTRGGEAQPRTVAAIAEAHRAAAADGLREVPPSRFGIERIVANLPRLAGNVRAPLSVRLPKANPGDQRQFTVLYSGIGGASTQCPNPVQNFTCYVNVTATLKAVSLRSYIWVDNVSLGNPNEFPDQSVFATAGTNFDSYFAIETQAFGGAYAPANVTNFSQCDANGNPVASQPVPDMTGVDPHISVLITDALVGTGEGGYFFAGDLLAQNILNCSPPPRFPSNGLPLLVIGSDNYQAVPAQNLSQYNPGYWVNTDMPRGLSHELQHYLHNINKYYGKLATNQPFVLDDAWIDEGCSMLAEDLAANGVAIDTPRYSYSYMLEPSDFSLTSFTGYQPNPLSTTATAPYGFYAYTAGNYGGAYLFLRYMYDRFGGANALHAIYADFRPGALGGGSNVNPILAAAGNAESWPQLFSEWSIAISAQSSGITTDPRYSFNPAIVLRGAVQVPSRRNPPQQIRNLVFGGPQPPETFDASGNLTGYVTLSSGSAPTVRALDGAANFFRPTPVTGGATVRAQTGSLTVPQGSIVQGQLPTPQPTSF